MSRFVRDSGGRGRSRDARRFLALHKDIIEEQTDIEDVKKKAIEGKNWLRRLPTFIKILILCIILLVLFIGIPFTVVATSHIFGDFGSMRRLTTTWFVGFLGLGSMIFMYVAFSNRI